MIREDSIRAPAVSRGALLLALAVGLLRLTTGCGNGDDSDGGKGAGAASGTGGSVAAASGTGGGAAAAWVFQNPLLTAERGEWALFRLSDGKTLRMEIRAVSLVTGVVTMLEEQRDEELNRPLASGLKTIHPNHFLMGQEEAGFVVAEIYPETIEAAGRTWQCLCVKSVSPRAGIVRSYYSPEAPVLGLVRQVKESLGSEEGLVLAEIMEWSRE